MPQDPFLTSSRMRRKNETQISTNFERWDVSRSLEQVLAERANP